MKFIEYIIKNTLYRYILQERQAGGELYPVDHVDNTLKKIIIRKLPNKRAETVVTAFRDIEANTFCEFKNLTADNGPEFALHKQITQITWAQVYFARPYHSWDRGLNEHINGLIRPFYPKGTDFKSGQSS